MTAEDGDFAGRWKPGPRAKALWRGALDLIFPPQALDGGPRPLAGGFSAGAWSRIHFLDGPVCDGCGVPFEYDPGSRCPACLARPRAFDAARAACLYDETSREPILKLKHADRTDLAPLFARWISRAARELVEEADAIVPVPLHRLRLLGRRYNQAAEIARALAALTGAPYLPDALVRRRATPTQGSPPAGAAATWPAPSRCRPPAASGWRACASSWSTTCSPPAPPQRPAPAP